MSAFVAGIKVAFDAEQAAKVLRLAKKKQLPKASKRLVETISGAPGGNRVLGDALASLKRTPIPGISESMVREMIGHTPPARIAKRVKGGVLFPGRGAIEKQLHRETFGALGKAPAVKNKKMLHAVIKGHELDEIAAKGRIGAAHFGHRNPDVIFREHNRLATLPKGHEDVVKFMQHYRAPREGATMFPKGMVYGQGPRLSRHARRRLSEVAEQRAVETAKLYAKAFGR
jgi:hypothetical protein